MSEWLSFLGWSFLPNIITNWVQKIYYGIVYRAGDVNVPKPGQRRYILHRKRIYVFVVLAYLTYTIVEVIHSIPPNYYDLLGVNQDFTNKELKSNLRKLQLAFHPDRNSEQQAESTFILLRVAYDTLNDPVKRFAYDRFGPDINDWNSCTTIRDYISTGKYSSVIFYLGTGSILLILNILGSGKFGKFWRFLVFLGMACVEFSLIFNPNNNNSFLLSYILKDFTIFEKIKIIRQLYITIFIAISEVGPVLFPYNSLDNDNDNINRKELANNLHELEILSNIANDDINNQLISSFHPFRNDKNSQDELKRKMESLLADNYLYQNDPEFVQTYNKIRKRKEK